MSVIGNPVGDEHSEICVIFSFDGTTQEGAY